MTEDENKAEHGLRACISCIVLSCGPHFLEIFAYVIGSLRDCALSFSTIFLQHRKKNFAEAVFLFFHPPPCLSIVKMFTLLFLFAVVVAAAASADVDEV